MATRLEKITAALRRPSACPSTIKSTDKASIAKWREESSPGTLENAPVGTYIGVGSGILSLIGGLVTKHLNSREDSIFSSALNGLGAISMGLGIGLSFNQSLSNDATQVIDEANIIQSTGEQKQQIIAKVKKAGSDGDSSRVPKWHEQFLNRGGIPSKYRSN